MASQGFDDLVILKIAKRIDEFAGKTAQAGFFPGQQYGDGTNIAYVAAIQNYGDPSHSIPPRPFMQDAVSKNREQWTQDAARGIRAIVRGSAQAEQVLSQLGGAMEGDVKAAIADMNSPALSPITVMLRGMRRNDPSLVVTGKTVGEAAERVKEGKTNYGASAKPLVDTGVMMAAVSHKVGGES
jgi:hypothetical protein